MNAPMDVLAVLQYTADMIEAIAPAVRDRVTGLDRDARELRGAITAVAELVKYARRIEQRDRGMIWGDEDAHAQDWAYFRYALARVRGVAA